MTRDLTLYPADSNGERLWQLSCSGLDASVPTTLVYQSLFRDEESALSFAVHLLKSSQEVSLENATQVNAHIKMLPTYENVSGYQSLIRDGSAAFGGRFFNWVLA